MWSIVRIWSFTPSMMTRTAKRCLVLPSSAALAALIAGCVSDAELLKENSRIAVETAEQRAVGELNCPQAKASIVTRKEIPGVPLGELYSQYGVRVSGCGREASYDVECRDEKICSVKEK